jgi:hypothetical protein
MQHKLAHNLNGNVLSLYNIKMSNLTPEQLNEYASHAMMLMGRAVIKACNDTITTNKKYIQDDHG